MAHNRKSAMLSVGSYKSALSDVIMQLYLWSDSQTRNHWRKELRGIVKNCRDNVNIKGGKLKKKDLVQSLDNIAIESNIKRNFLGMIKDPDYSSYVTTRSLAPSEDKMQQFIEMFALSLISDSEDDWSIADGLIDVIESW